MKFIPIEAIPMLAFLFGVGCVRSRFLIQIQYPKLYQTSPDYKSPVSNLEPDAIVDSEEKMPTPPPRVWPQEANQE